MTTPVNGKTTFPWLDLLRGLSAMIVVFCHLRALAFIRYEEAGNIGLSGKVFYFFTSQFGSMAVLVFFVLSGYFITRSIDNLYMRQRWSFDVYFTDRLTRLYTVLIPALLLTFLFDSLAYILFPSAPFYVGELSHLERNTPSFRMDFQHFLGSLFFMQKILVPAFGSNGPLWSLSYEFWYYVLYPLMFFAAVGVTRKWLFGLLTLLISVFIGYFNINILIYFFVWLMGSAAYFLSKKVGNNYEHATVKALLATSVLIAVMIFARLKIVPLVVTDFMIGFSAAVTTFTLLYVRCPERVLPIARFLSNISYTLYLIHFPFLAFISSAIGFYNVRFNSLNILIFAGLYLTVIFVAFCVWWLFERNTSLIRDFFRRRVVRSVPALHE